MCQKKILNKIILPKTRSACFWKNNFFRMTQLCFTLRSLLARRSFSEGGGVRGFYDSIPRSAAILSSTGGCVINAFLKKLFLSRPSLFPSKGEAM